VKAKAKAKAKAAPSDATLARLRQLIQRRLDVWPNRQSSSIEMQQSKARKINRVLACEMRRRGWLHEEGYAPGSWAADERLPPGYAYIVMPEDE
jgi:hypothetical protein